MSITEMPLDRAEAIARSRAEGLEFPGGRVYRSLLDELDRLRAAERADVSSAARLAASAWQKMPFEVARQLPEPLRTALDHLVDELGGGR